MSPCTAGDRVCGCCVGGVRAAVPRGQPLRAFGAGVEQATGRRLLRGRGRTGWVSHLSPSPVR